jgi:hypothetical protein
MTPKLWKLKKNIKVEHDVETSENDKSSSSLSNYALINARVKDDKLHTLNSKHNR